MERYVRGIGRRKMVLNARRLHQGEREEPSILLSIEDATDVPKSAGEKRPPR